MVGDVDNLFFYGRSDKERGVSEVGWKNVVRGFLK